MTNLNYIQSKYYITSRTNKNGIITYASEAFCKISGYSEAELIGKPHSIVRHPDMPAQTFKDLWETISQGKVWTGVVKNLKKDGGYYWVDSSIEPIFDNKMEIIGYISIRFDITEHFELEENRKELENTVKKFEKLFENINSGVAILDEDGNFLDVNPYLCRLLAYTKDEILKTSCINLSAEKYIDKTVEMLAHINLNNEKKKIVKQCLSKNNEEIWVEASYSKFEENRILLTVKNIEPYKKLEKTTRMLIDQSKDAAMGEMLAMIAHQWRQPLSTIITILSKARIKNELDSYSKNEFETDFNKMGSVINHLSKTIEFFRNYFKPKTGQKESIENIIESLMNITAPLAAKENILMSFHFESDKNILVDNRIDQVLLNIFKNSMEACFEKNSKGTINTYIKKENNKLLIEIYDDAGGIDENIIGKIFEPYFSTKSKNGTGLGLYMSKNIIEEIGGHLYARNSDNGACFIIELFIDGDK